MYDICENSGRVVALAHVYGNIVKTFFDFHGIENKIHGFLERSERINTFKKQLK